jgi:hypothetical protein
MIEPITYRGATLHVSHMPSSWKIFVYMPGSHSALVETPCTEDEGLNASILQAKRMVDVALTELDMLAIDVAHLTRSRKVHPRSAYEVSCVCSGSRDDRASRLNAC